MDVERQGRRGHRVEHRQSRLVHAQPWHLQRAARSAIASLHGGLIASLAIPWGFSKGDNDLGGYHLVWPRDMVETAGGLLAAGAHEDSDLSSQDTGLGVRFTDLPTQAGADVMVNYVVGDDTAAAVVEQIRHSGVEGAA